MGVDDTPQQGALNRATGLPFSDSTTTYSPQVNTSAVQNTPERQGFVDAEQLAYKDQAAATKTAAFREAEVARQQAEIMRAQAAQDEQYAVERERIRQDHAGRIAEAQNLQRQRVNEAMKDPGGYWDNKTSFDKTMTRVLIGLGSMGGGDNKMLALVNDEIEKDLKSKQIRSERLFKQAELARGYASDALRARAEELSDLDTNRAALWNIVAKRTELAAKSGMAGKITAEMQAKIAEIQQAAAEKGIKASEAVATKVDVQGAHESTTQAIGTKVGSGEVQREKANEIAVTNMQLRGLDERNDLIRRNPEAWKAYQDALREVDETQKLSESTLGKAVNLLQGTGVTAMAVDQRLAKIEDPAVKAAAKRLNQLDPIVHAAQARILDPVGVLNEGSLQAARKSLNLYTSEPDEAIKIGKQFRQQFEERSSLLNAGNKMAMANASIEEEKRQRAGKKGESAPVSPQLKRDLIEAHKALLDPKADPAVKAAAKRFIADHGGK